MSDIEGLDELASGRTVGYIGFDCTAPSLHVGSLIPIMMLHWLQQAGGKPIALMGGGTTGSAIRPARTRAAHAHRSRRSTPTRRHQVVFEQFLSFGDRRHRRDDDRQRRVAATRLNYIDFLRDVGRHFSVNRMLTMDGASSV